MADLSVPLDEPYFDSNISVITGENPSAVGIAGRVYLMDNLSGEYASQSIDVVQQRNSGDDRDQLLLPQDVWRESSSGWHEGAGQSNSDREDSLPYRFDSSYGVNPWVQWQLSLLHRTEQLQDLSGAGDVLLGVHDDKLVVALDNEMFWWDDLGGASATASAGSASIISMTYDGDAIITLHNGGEVWKSTAPGTSSLFGTFPGATFIEYVKDYLIAGIGDTLSDITSGSATTIFVSPTAGFRWLGATDGMAGIYLVGGANDRWVVHRVGIADDGTGLQPAIVVATLPTGEVASCIGSYLGFVFVGTSNGVRMATPQGDGSLVLGSLIPTGSAVRDFEGQGQYVWYTDSRIDGAYEVNGVTLAAFPTQRVAGLGRMDLTVTTVNDSTPAYANDLVTAVTGGTVRSIITFKGKRVIGINNEGVWYEHDEFMEAGWLKEGAITFGVEDTKTGLYEQTRWLPLDGSVGQDAAFDGGPWNRISLSQIQGSVGSGNASLNGAQFGRVQGRLLLGATDDLTESPVVTRWEIRARPIVGQATRWSLPIINHEILDIGGIYENRDCQAEFDRLKGLVESGQMFILQEQGRAYQVVAKQFQWRPQSITQNNRSWEGIFQLIVDQVV